VNERTHPPAHRLLRQRCGATHAPASDLAHAAAVLRVPVRAQVGVCILLPLGMISWHMFSASKYTGPNQVLNDTLGVFMWSKYAVKESQVRACVGMCACACVCGVGWGGRGCARACVTQPADQIAVAGLC
jgi:hypothetical protein